MFRFAIKASIAGTAVYYVNEEGVWKDSEEALKIYNKICTNISPYLEMAKKRIPIEIPTVPNTDRVSYMAAEYWNLGVLTTFKFLTDLPETTSELADVAYTNLLSNSDLQKLLDSTKSKEVVEVKNGGDVKK